MCTKFVIDSSSRFPFTARTNRQTDRQTDATERLTHDGGYTAGVDNDIAQKKWFLKLVLRGEESLRWDGFVRQVG